jgi:hypothetical protein
MEHSRTIFLMNQGFALVHAPEWLTAPLMKTINAVGKNVMQGGGYHFLLSHTYLWLYSIILLQHMLLLTQILFLIQVSISTCHVVGDARYTQSYSAHS